MRIKFVKFEGKILQCFVNDSIVEFRIKPGSIEKKDLYSAIIEIKADAEDLYSMLLNHVGYAIHIPKEDDDDDAL